MFVSAAQTNLMPSIFKLFQQLLHTLFFLAEFWAALYSDISFCRRFSRLCSANKNPSSNNCRATSPVPSSFVYSDTMSSITREVSTYKVIHQTQVNTRYINSVTRRLKNVDLSVFQLNENFSHIIQTEMKNFNQYPLKLATCSLSREVLFCIWAYLLFSYGIQSATNFIERNTTAMQKASQTAEISASN